MHQPEESKVRVAVRIAAALDKIRIPLLIVVIALAAFVVGYFVYSEISANVRERVAANVEAADELYLEWLFEQDAEAKSRLEANLIERLTSVQERYGRQYGGQRAAFLQGQLYLEKEDYDSALVAFRRLAETAEKSYLGTEGLYNVAVVLEETGEAEQALAAYRRLLDEHPQSVHIPHAHFSVGRILESQEMYDEALAAYETIRSTYAQSSWTNFAVNRIIWLKSTGKVSGE